MVAWLELQEKRSWLDCKRHRPKPLYEVTYDELDCRQPIYFDNVPLKDAYNNGHRYWGFMCDNQVISFSWETYKYRHTRFVIGARCEVTSALESFKGKALVGTTRLGPEDIQKAGLTTISSMC